MSERQKKYDEEQKRILEARQKISAAALAAIKEAVPHPEFSIIWHDASMPTQNDGDIDAAVQRALDMDTEIREKILTPAELLNEARTRSFGESGETQRIISPERNQLYDKLHTQFAADFMDDDVGRTAPGAAKTAAFRARSFEEAIFIYHCIILQERLADKPTDALKQELASVVQELAAVRETLPKYVSPPPRDWNKFSAVSNLLSFYDLSAEAKRELRKRLEPFPIEEIQKRTAVFQAKNAAAAAALLAKQKSSGFFGKLFGGRRSRKSRTRKQRKN
jgi:hypothetical protein